MMTTENNSVTIRFTGLFQRLSGVQESETSEKREQEMSLMNGSRASGGSDPLLITPFDPAFFINSKTPPPLKKKIARAVDKVHFVELLFPMNIPHYLFLNPSFLNCFWVKS